MTSAPIPSERPINLKGSRPESTAELSRAKIILVLALAALVGLLIAAGLSVFGTRPAASRVSSPTRAERSFLPTLSDLAAPPLPPGEATYIKHQSGRYMYLEYRFEPESRETYPVEQSPLRQALAADRGKPLPVKMISRLYVEPTAEIAQQTYAQIIGIWLTDAERGQKNTLTEFADEAFGISLLGDEVEQGGFAVFRTGNKVLMTMFYGRSLSSEQGWPGLLEPYLQRLAGFSIE